MVGVLGPELYILWGGTKFWQPTIRGRDFNILHGCQEVLRGVGEGVVCAQTQSTVSRLLAGVEVCGGDEGVCGRGDSCGYCLRGRG